MLGQERGQHEAAAAEAGQHQEAGLQLAGQGQAVGRGGAHAGAALKRDLRQLGGEGRPRPGQELEVAAVVVVADVDIALAAVVGPAWVTRSSRVTTE